MPTDRSRFSMHPEDWVPQRDSHDEQGAYLKYGLRLLLPDCDVARDLAVYWVPGQTRHPYVGPDIFVAQRQPLVEDPQAVAPVLWQVNAVLEGQQDAATVRLDLHGTPFQQRVWKTLLRLPRGTTWSWFPS